MVRGRSVLVTLKLSVRVVFLPDSLVETATGGVPSLKLTIKLAFVPRLGITSQLST
jgi:hypothetical protein